MTKVKPTHSALETNVYHNETECNTRNNIEKENVQRGKGGKNLCKECKGH